jgi:hypothetical protein
MEDMMGSSRPRRSGGQVRFALVLAILMLAIRPVLHFAHRFGVPDSNELAIRAVLVLTAIFIVATGNSMPKRLVPPACLRTEPGRAQAFMRFAGWTWVLTGILFGIAVAVLPSAAGTTATLIIVPAGMASIAIRWWMSFAGRGRAS